jgi:glyoxylase-like metal-dependent hydrolase (beta-lactamase superfamily II)
VLEKVDRYLQLVKELDLKLVKAVDTHLHADHITHVAASVRAGGGIPFIGVAGPTGSSIGRLA